MSRREAIRGWIESAKGSAVFMARDGNCGERRGDSVRRIVDV